MHAPSEYSLPELSKHVTPLLALAMLGAPKLKAPRAAKVRPAERPTLNLRFVSFCIRFLRMDDVNRPGRRRSASSQARTLSPAGRSRGAAADSPLFSG